MPHLSDCLVDECFWERCASSALCHRMGAGYWSLSRSRMLWPAPAMALEGSTALTCCSMSGHTWTGTGALPLRRSMRTDTPAGHCQRAASTLYRKCTASAVRHPSLQAAQQYLCAYALHACVRASWSLLGMGQNFRVSICKGAVCIVCAEGGSALEYVCRGELQAKERHGPHQVGAHLLCRPYCSPRASTKIQKAARVQQRAGNSQLSQYSECHSIACWHPHDIVCSCSGPSIIDRAQSWSWQPLICMCICLRWLWSHSKSCRI